MKYLLYVTLAVLTPAALAQPAPQPTAAKPAAPPAAKPATPPAAKPAAQPSAAAGQLAGLEAFIADHAKQRAFSGTIAIQRAGKTVYTRSFGLASIAFQIPNTDATRYKIASITKAFTAVLILQLRDRGKLDLARPIKAYWPAYAGPGGDKITIHQLLNHTSGLDNLDKVKSAEDAIRNGVPPYQAPYTPDQLLARFCGAPLVHEPGKVFDYNNADYLVLGRIVEQLYGQPFDRVLQQQILEPLKLRDTGMLRQRDIVPRLAETYFMRDDLKALVPDLPVYAENWHAAGAMYSTVEDLLAFSAALFGGKLISADSLTRMTRPGLDDYGYGVWSYETKIAGKAHRVVKRPGQIMGAQAQLYHFFAPDLTIVILSNAGTTDLDDFVAAIGKHAVG